jgi:hypothetical protein
MQERSREQLNARSPTQSTYQSSSSTATNSAAGNQSPMLYGAMHTNYNDDDWSAQQQQQYVSYQYQQYQQQHSSLGMQGLPASQVASSSHYNAYPSQMNYASSYQDHNASHAYQPNAYHGNGLGGSNLATPSFGSQQAPYQQLQTPLSSRQNQAIRSPRQQFADTLKRGVQNIAFTPAGNANEAVSRSISQIAALPARPDSAIRAAQGNQGGYIDPTVQAMIHSSQGGLTSTSATPSNPIAAPPRPAPSLPLATRFTPLPPKPPIPEDLSNEQKEVLKKFETREDALLLRVDALGFQPEAAWQVIRESVDGKKLDSSEELSQDHRETPAPILGIRLLQRLELLQKENEELEAIFKGRISEKGGAELQGESMIAR